MALGAINLPVLVEKPKEYTVKFDFQAAADRLNGAISVMDVPTECRGRPLNALCAVVVLWPHHKTHDQI